MNFLFDNPLANLPGPEFLVLYILFIITTITGFRLLKNRLDKTAHFAVPPIPHKPDPFVIAYLRGGENELARTVVFSLAQKNLLKFVNGDKKSEVHPTKIEYDRRSLQPIEQTALNWFDGNRETKEIFKKDGLANTLKMYADVFQSQLEMHHFIPDEEMNRRNSRLALKAFLLFGSLGAYKFIAAFMNGYSNVAGIIIITIIGTIVLGVTAKMSRLTNLGKTYLERLQLAFDKVKPSNHYTELNASPVPAATFAAVDPFLLSVGVFGGAALAGTIYSDYNRTFERAQNQSGGSSGCGAGCGSSSCSSGGCSGGSCGGGCGGCG
jgi:uncharacterized protein (TIGR04222 family)